MTIYNNPTIKVKLRNSTTLSVPLPPFVNINAVNIAVTNSISIGTGLVNTQINSTSISLRSVRANNSFGTAGQVLTTNGTGVYWSTVTGGGGGSFSNGIAYIWSDVQTFEANVFVSNAILSVGNTSSNVTANTTHIIIGDATVNATINSTAFSGTANNATNVDGTSLSTIQGQITGNAATAYTNAVTDAATSAASLYQTTAGLAANVATLTANNSAFLGGIPAANYAVLSSTTSTFTGNLAANNAETFNNLNVGGNLTVEGNVFITGAVVSLLGNTSTFVDNMIFLNQGIEATITNVSGSGTVITFTANNNFFAGWDVLVNSVNPVSYNGLYTNILAANATHFQVSNTNVQPYVSGGTARGKSDANPDLGVAAAYNDGTYRHTGIFRDASDSYWKIFDGYLPEPDDSLFINTSDASFNIASFWAGSIRLGNTSVYSTVNTTIYEGTANNANNLGGVSLVTLQNQITGNSITAYTNAVTDAATSAAGLYQTTAGLAANVLTLTANNSNRLGNELPAFYRDATNIITGTLPFARLPANAVFWSNTNTFTAVQTFNQNLVVNSATLSVGNTTSNVTTNTTHIVVGNSSVNVSINSTAFSGTANNANNLGGVPAANYTNTTGAYTITGVHTHNANIFVNSAALSVGNTTANVTANTTHIVVGNSSVNVSINSTAFSGTATNITGVLNYTSLPANVVIWSNTNTFTAVQTLNQNLIVNSATLSVGNTTANVTANTTHIVVGNTSVNVSINSTAFSGTSANATNLNGQPGSYYTNADNISTGTVPVSRLPANIVFWSNTNTFTAVQTLNQNLIVNSAVLSVGNTTANVTANTTHIVVGNSSVNVSINSTAFSGTSANATNLNGQPGSYYTNATNLATGTVPTSRLATSGTPSSTTFLRGDQVWATPPGGGGGSPGGATGDIQFNDAGAFQGSSNLKFDNATTLLTVGNNTVNTQINSSSIALRTLIANGGVGSAGQVLTSSGSGANIYWSTVSGGGGGGEVVTAVSINTSMAAPTTFYLASGTITLTLPTAVGNSGLKFQVKNTTTGQITIATTSSQTIDGNINMILTEKNSVIGLISDGTNWSIF
jgi:hypothetical protein